MPTVPSIPTFVVAGFLGAGKTTFVNALLERSEIPIAVVVNDFGAVNIDAALIRNQTDTLIELSNGCICCSVGESLADALFSILDRPHQPSQIVIEASGVADPAAVAAYTHLEGLHFGGTVVLIDAVNALAHATDPYVARTFQRQLRGAHLFVITKKDIASQQHTEQVEQMLTTERPEVPCVDASCNIFSSVFILDAKITQNAPDQDLYSSQVLTKNIFEDDNDIISALSELPDVVLRAKGIVELTNGQRRLVQKVGTHISIVPTSIEPTGIVVITPRPSE